MILRFQRCLKVLISFLAAGDKLVSNSSITFSFPETVLSLIETSSSPVPTCNFSPESSMSLDFNVCVLKKLRAPRGKDSDFRAHIACLLRRFEFNWSLDTGMLVVTELRDDFKVRWFACRSRRSRGVKLWRLKPQHGVYVYKSFRQ